MRFSKINGQLVPAEEVNEFARNLSVAGVLGMLETMLVLNGEIQLKSYHWQRLRDGALLIGIPDIDTNSLEQAISDLIRKNELDAICKIRLQVYPNDKQELSQYAIEACAIQPELIVFNTSGLAAGIAQHSTKARGPLANCKTTDRSLYVAAEEFAKARQWDEAFVKNDSGRVIETAIYNVFWIKNNIVYTPPLSEGCVAGISRRHLLAELPRLGYTVEEHPLTEAMLYDADEVFLSNAIRRIKWVAQIGDRIYSNSLSSEIASLLFP